MEKWDHRSSCCGRAETNLTSIHEEVGLIPGLAQSVSQGSSIGLSCGVRSKTQLKSHVSVAVA